MRDVPWISAPTALLCLVIASDRAPADGPAAPDVENVSAEAVGTTGLSVNGVIHPHGRPTSYYVEYGPTEALGRKTAAAALPARLAAYYHESWDESAGGWQGGMSGKDSAHHPTGGAAGGFLRFTEPSGNDPNHIDGIGTLHLCKYVYPGLLSGANGTLMLGGGEPDFRNARVSLAVRGSQWKANGSELVWWTQSQSNIEKLYSPEWRRANWAYTGQSLTPLLSSGKWEKIEYRLKNDSTEWSYGGNNLAQKRPNYEYWPIDDSQRRLNNDFFHLLTFVDPANLPQGSIDFDELIVAYHNNSVLIPSNGGTLVSSPTGGDDAARLTDGWRHGAGKTWKSAANPTAASFVWKLENPVTIDTVLVHQNVAAPSKSLEIQVSNDNTTWSPLTRLELPENSPHGPNYAYALARPAKTPARFVKVTINAGYRADAWGLGEIEVFGAGATMLPENEPTPVTTDLTGLEPGSTCHFRFVAVSGDTTRPGKTMSATVPATQRPLALTRPASRLGPSTARLEGRLNAMGKATKFWFEYGTDTTYGKKTAETYGGLQVTPRLAAAIVEGLEPGREYHYRLVATNEAGVTHAADQSFRTPPAP